MRQRQVEGLQLAAQRNALFQLSQLRRVKHYFQLRLAHQHDLEKLLLRRLQVGEQPEFCQQLGAQCLCFIHHQRGNQSSRMTLDEEAIEVEQHFGLGASLVGEAQVRHDVLKELDHRQQRVEHIAEGD